VAESILSPVNTLTLRLEWTTASNSLEFIRGLSKVVLELGSGLAFSTILFIEARKPVSEFFF
jgi:hypothetical protein